MVQRYIQGIDGCVGILVTDIDGPYPAIAMSMARSPKTAEKWVEEGIYVRSAGSYVCDFYAVAMFGEGDGRVDVVAQCILPQVMLTIQPWEIDGN